MGGEFIQQQDTKQKYIRYLADALGMNDTSGLKVRLPRASTYALQETLLSFYVSPLLSHTIRGEFRDKVDAWLRQPRDGTAPRSILTSEIFENFE